MKEFEDAVLEISWNNLQSEQNRYKDSDAKAVNLITIAGILTTLLIGFGTKSGYFGRIMFILSVMLLFLTVMFSAVSMASRKMEVLSTQCLIDGLEHADIENQVPGIIATVAVVESGLRKVNGEKAKWVQLAIISLSIAVASMLIYSLFLSLEAMSVISLPVAWNLVTFCGAGWAFTAGGLLVPFFDVMCPHS